MNKGMDIERESFAIIDTLCDFSRFSPAEKAVAARLVHTTGDPDFANIVRFSKDATERGMDALRRGVPVICDTNMVKTGITTRFTGTTGINLHCYITDKEVIERAAAEGTTRAHVAMDVAAERHPEAIFAIGNAPTALLRLLALAAAKKLSPALVIGLPVGFVMAAESKAMLLETDLPFITNIGNKGGSPCAAATVNALIRTAFGLA